MPSKQSTALLAAALLGSLVQHVIAAPEASSISLSSKRGDVQFPQCISKCVRNSGCFDDSCVCSKAGAGVLSDIVICMNQWCPADVTAKDLIGPLQGKCDLPASAVQDAEKKGGVASSDDTSAEPTTAAAATPTASGKGGNEGHSGDDTPVTTFDVGAPVTAAAPPATTVTPATPVTTGGTLVIGTDAATTGLLTDSDSKPTSAGSLVIATSTPPVPSPSTSASSPNGTGSSSPTDENGASITGQASMFGLVAAVGVVLALGF
ncbi:hypothetical protein F5Y19DRAFT_94662 [Xylariaceae sp. FL1651]|nr:hypothetical protein F5Y19DRAFT_94662 [Xylariaceae sp. FL1651]